MHNGANRPVVLIVDDEPLNRRFAASVLVAQGWRVETASDGTAAIEQMRNSPDLVLMDLHMAGMSGLDTLAAIRGGGDPAASTPVLAYTTTRLSDPAALRARGFDGFIPKPCTPAELAAAAARWWPDEVAATLERLEVDFGAEAIGSMVDRFRDLLIEALAQTDEDVAHRIAGIAGTLGFAAVGRAWLAVSEGDSAARDEAWRTARQAIATIDRRRNN